LEETQEFLLSPEVGHAKFTVHPNEYIGHLSLAILTRPRPRVPGVGQVLVVTVAGIRLLKEYTESRFLSAAKAYGKAGNALSPEAFRDLIKITV